VVLPTRGEGWGRPQMEAMSMARPLITTNWSGPTAYINADNAYPLSIEGLVAAAQGGCQRCFVCVCGGLIHAQCFGATRSNLQTPPRELHC